MEPTTEQIRQAVEAHCGGYAGASDEDIADRWRQVPPEVRAEWLSGTEEATEA